MEKKLYELKIDPELRDYIPPLRDWEYESLRERIITEGCLEPLVVWDGVIVDGHNRYKICHENGIPFEYIEHSFEDKLQAKLWMAENQLGRRNLNPFQKCELVYPLEPVLKEEVLEKKRKAISSFRKGNEVPPNLAGSKDARDVMAKMAGVSHGTWDMAKAIIEEAPEDVKEEIRRENASIYKVFSLLRPKKKPEKEPLVKEQEPASPTEAKEPKTAPPVYRTDHMDDPIEVPSMRDKPEKDPRPYMFVKDQVGFAMRNMLKELQIGLNMLKDEDKDKIPELQDLVDKAYECAKNLITQMEGK